MTKILEKAVLGLVTVVVMTACQGNVLYHSYCPLSPDGWDRCDTVWFDADVQFDETMAYQYRIGIRHSDSYPYRDIWLKAGRDTLHIHLADGEGRWKGNGIGETHLLELPVNLYAPEDTSGRIGVIHLMQHNPLPGVSHIGLCLMKAASGIQAQEDKQKNGETP